MGKYSLYIWIPINTKRENNTIFLQKLTLVLVHAFCAKTFQYALVVLILDLSLD